MPEATLEAEQEVSPGTPAPPETGRPAQGMLRRTFQNESGPFKIDLDPLTIAPRDRKLSEILDDPSFARHLAGQSHIYTDEIRTEVFTPELRARMELIAPTPSPGASWQNHYLANREQLRETTIAAGEQFMQNLREASPELHDLIQKEIEKSMQDRQSAENAQNTLTPAEDIALSQVSRASSFLNNYFVSTSYANEKLNITEETTPEDIEAQAEAIRASKTVMAFMPGENFSFADSTKTHRALAQAGTAPPGTNEEWAALVAAHEMEHYIDASKDRDPKIMSPELRAMLEMTEPDFLMGSLQEGMAHLREIEADLSAVHAVEGKVTPEILPYWAALRTGDSMIETMPQILREKIPDDQGIQMMRPHVRDTHDTGYFLSEYLETGAIPEYMHLKEATDGFYGKTADQYIAAAQNALRQSNAPGASLSSLPAPSLSDMVDLVQRTLTQDPPVYTPAEAQMAQKFVDGMTGPLGIERGNIDQALANTTASLPRQPENTPAPAAAPAIN